MTFRNIEKFQSTCSSKWLLILEQVKLLFAGERKVCDEMFEGFDSLSDQCFAEVTASSVSVLLSFGEAIARSKRSPEKLFVLLDMYEIMRELHSEVCLLLLNSWGQWEGMDKIEVSILFSSILLGWSGIFNF